MIVHFKHVQQLLIYCLSNSSLYFQFVPAASFSSLDISGFQSSKSTTISSLLQYPIVADAFRKSNSTLPRSAAVERLFSASTQVLSARRRRMTDDTLDRLLFLRSIRRSLKPLV